MKRILARIVFLLNLLGFDLLKFLSFFGGIWYYFRSYSKLKKQLKFGNDFLTIKYFPVLNDRFSESGSIKSHYFHQDLLIARRIFELKPVRHVDIGSRIDGFVAHVAVFREIEIFDIRPVKTDLRNIIYTQADLMQPAENLRGYCDSLSSLHAIEHFGLGRYGDSIDVNGHIKAIENIHSILKPNGRFFFSVPIGMQRIEFNAHRVFSISYLLEKLKGKFILENFSFVDDKGILHCNVELDEERISNNCLCKYGCGIFELVKI